MFWKGAVLSFIAFVTILTVGYLCATYWEGFGYA
jgi:hypothetical protein